MVEGADISRLALDRDLYICPLITQLDDTVACGVDSQGDGLGLPIRHLQSLLTRLTENRYGMMFVEQIDSALHINSSSSQ